MLCFLLSTDAVFKVLFLELKSVYESQLVEKENEFERQRVELETKFNQACEDNASQIAALKSDHEVQLNQNRVNYETALENLEREKDEILKG